MDETPTDGRTASSERSRQRLLDAALAEFAQHGYAGARVAAIAERAGVNKQLISYHFGGKQGLYEQLGRRWLGVEEQMRADAPTLAELVGRYLDQALAEPTRVRLSAQQLLDGTFPSIPSDDESIDLADLRARQAAGELADDLDVGAVMLALMGMVAAPVLLGADLVHGDVELYRRQVLRIVELLAGPR